MLGHGMRLQLLTERQTDAERERERETGFFSIDFVIFPQNPSEWIGQVGYSLLGVSTPKNAIAQD